MKQLCLIILFTMLIFLFSCSSQIIKDYENTDTFPGIFPDYIQTTIPLNIAPLNFRCVDSVDQAMLLIKGESDSIQILSEGTFNIPKHKWERILEENKGGKINMTVYTKKNEKWKKYKPFPIFIAPDSIDPYFAFRLIEPGYSAWYKMGIYQRNLEGYNKSTIYDNKLSDFNCVNCHSFCMQDPKRMLFHIRGGLNSGTVLIRDNKIDKLNTEADTIYKPLIYPSWHPSGNYVAFSVNKILQSFYSNNKDRVEVYDLKSDVVIYDLLEEQIFTAPNLSSVNAFETFPSFSPDGKTLYFCSALAVNMPEKIDSVRYNLCSVSFNPETKTIGEKVDTLYNAQKSGGSASFPRISPDGKYLMYTLGEFGNFHIWHKKADLCLLDLESGKHINMRNVNSNDVESYHSWSSNSRWFIFSSRRLDGLYTRPYIAYLDKTGKTGKAFLVPQKDPDYYDQLMKSYNIPEMIKGKVKINGRKLASSP